MARVVCWRNLLALLAVLLTLVIVIRPASQSHPFTASVGQSLPASHVISSTGQVQSLRRLFRGRGGLLNFWAPWCPACKMELPDFSRKFPQVTIALVTNDTIAAATPLLNASGVEARRAYYDTTGQVFTQYLISTLPTTLFINRHGVVVAKVIGPMTPALLDHDLSMATQNQGR